MRGKRQERRELNHRGIDSLKERAVRIETLFPLVKVVDVPGRRARERAARIETLFAWSAYFAVKSPRGLKPLDESVRAGLNYAAA